MIESLLLIGAGRMGQRHLRGLQEVEGVIHVVDPQPAVAAAVDAIASEANLKARVIHHATLETAFAAVSCFDAAILAATAADRLGSFRAVLDHGVRRILLEKPVEQSRARFRETLALAHAHGAKVQCNLYRRSLEAFHVLRNRGPMTIAVNSGASGLGCNGIHWIDFAHFLAGEGGGRLLFAEIEDTPIASGRGPNFRDYGGRGVFAFADGSRLMLSVGAGSPMSTTFSIVTPHAHWLVDQDADTATVHDRRPDSVKPNYLYGQDCDRRQLEGIERIDFPALTRSWIREITGGPRSALPDLEASAAAHELMFDLLESGNGTLFPFT